MRFRRPRSLRAPIILAAVSVPLSVALLVGWIFVVVQNLSLTQEVTQNTLLMVLGGLFFVVIMGVLITFSVFLSREILEVRRQDSFIDSVTHELKSPLASLKLCLETMERGSLPSSKRQELRQMMLTDVERLSTFVDDVLQASRLSVAGGAYTLTDVCLRDVIDRAATSVLEKHHVDPDSIKIEIPRHLKLNSDPTALGVIFRNLLDNAVKYSDKNPEVHVTCSPTRDERSILVSVSDRGIGIPPNMQRKVFQRFFRGSTESVRRRKGTGLGLFVVSSLVRNLGGKVHAESRDAGGTRIVVRLPLGVQS